MPAPAKTAERAPSAAADRNTIAVSTPGVMVRMVMATRNAANRAGSNMGEALGYWGETAGTGTRRPSPLQPLNWTAAPRPA